MKFSKKIFISVFVTTLVLGTGITWVAHKYISDQTEENYISRYSVFTKVMGDTLTHLDKNTETFMLNTAKVIAEHDEKKGLLSTNDLKTLRDELNVTHLFVLDSKGNFIRSTNEDPKLIPNVFNFCQDYKKIFAQKKFVESTPILQPRPEPKPYKFLFVPSHDHQRIIEVGMRVDFVAKTLSEALGSDSNLVSLSLYSPDGNAFAKFNSKEFEFRSGKETLPDSFPAIRDTGDVLHVYAKVASSHPQCCQCDVSGTSKNGEYYYILESEISKKELTAILATTKSSFVLLALVNLLFSFALSRLVSRRLVRNIEAAAEKVRTLEKSGSLNRRIGLGGKDEVAFLTQEFDRLLDTLEDSQRKIVEGEKIQIKVQMAKEIAHNIKSPIVAIEMMMPMLSRLPERMQKVFRDSTREIKALADRLSRQADTLSQEIRPPQTEAIFLPKLVERVVSEKRVEYSNLDQLHIKYKSEGLFIDTFVRADPSELRAVLSNLINNAVEAYDNKAGTIDVLFKSVSEECVIEVKDSGKGIPNEILSLAYPPVKDQSMGMTWKSQFKRL